MSCYGHLELPNLLLQFCLTWVPIWAKIPELCTSITLCICQEMMEVQDFNACSGLSTYDGGVEGMLFLHFIYPLIEDSGDPNISIVFFSN